jgi:hypothetical protein
VAGSSRSRSSDTRGRRCVALAAIAFLALPGCSDRTQSAHAARTAVDRYLLALASHDSQALHNLAIGSFSDAAVLGGDVLRLGVVRRISVHTLDSLATVAASELRECGDAWTQASEENADSLWLRRRALFLRLTLYANALDAARRSANTPAESVDVCRVRVRIRWGGPLVGPEPVDREHVVRVLAAPGGRWIVFSTFLRQDDPPAEPI